MASNVLYGMAPCFGHTGVTFDAENDRPGSGSLRGHFDAARGRFMRLTLCWSRSDRWPSAGTSCFGHTGVTFDAENDRPGPGSLQVHFEAARGYFFLD